MADNWENLSSTELERIELQNANRASEDVSGREMYIDGGSGVATVNVLVNAAGWDPDMIYIGDIPKEIVDYAAAMYMALNSEDQELIKEVRSFLGSGSLSAPGGGSGATGTISGDLSDEAKAKIKGQLNQKNLDACMPRYKHAEKETGVPWWALAAIHFREAGNRPGASITNGQALGTGTNVDGVFISNDANKDAVNAARHFISMGKSVYKVDPSKPGDMKLEDWCNAWLAWNRGGGFKKRNVDYTKSPYVMNFYNNDYWHMEWSSADKEINSAANGGRPSKLGKDSNVGVMPVALYLGGNI